MTFRVATCALAFAAQLLAGVSEAQVGRYHWRSLASERATSIVLADDGVPWATLGGRLAWYDGYEWVTVAEVGGPEWVGWRDPVPAPGSGVLLVNRGRVYRVNKSSTRQLPTEHAHGWERAESVQALGDRIFVQLQTIDGTTPRAEFVEITGDGVRHFPSIDQGPVRFARAFWGLETSRFLADTSVGLARFRGDRWDGVLPLPDDHDVEIAVESASGMGLAAVTYPSEMAGLWRWTDTTAPERLPAQASRVRSIAITPDNGSLLVLDSGDVVVIDPDGAQHDVMAPPGTIDISVGRDGRVWIAGEYGISVSAGGSDPIRWQRIPGPSGRAARVHELLLRSDGSLWAATADGLVIYGNGEPRQIREIDGRRLMVVTGLGEDRAGNVWITSGSTFRGAYRWDGSEWAWFGSDHGLAEGYYHRVVVDSAGDLWLLGLSDDRHAARVIGGIGAARRVGESFEIWNTERGLPSGVVYDLERAADGALWFATYGGVARLQDGQWDTWTEPDLALGRVFDLAIGQDGSAFLAYQAAGLGVIAPDGKVDLITPADGLPFTGINRLVAAPDGALWLGGAGGVARSWSGDMEQISRIEDLRSTAVWPLLVDEDVLYAGTLGSGVARLDLDFSAPPLPRLRVAPPIVEADQVQLSWSVLTWQGQPPAGDLHTRHRLDGGTWSPWTRQRSVTLEEPVPGSRRFEVELQTPFPSAEIVRGRTAFVIPTPALRNPLFWALGFGGLATLGLLRHRHVHRDRRALLQTEQVLRDVAMGISAEPGSDFFASLVANLGRELHLDYAFVSVYPASPTDRPPVAARSLAVWSRRGDLESFEYQAAGTPCENVHRLGLRVVSDQLLEHFPNSPLLAQLQCRSYAGAPLRDADGRIFGVLAVLGSGPIRHPQIVRSTLQIFAIRAAEELRWLDTEQELQQRERELHQAQKMEAIGRLAGGIAHDFNNLLTVITGSAELARQATDMDTPVHEDITRILETSSRAAELTRQLLTFTRHDAHDPGPCDPALETTELRSLLQSLLGEEHRLVLEIQDGVPGVPCGSSGLHQVLMNLVVNAGQASQPGDAVRVHLAARGGRVILSVIDQGIGMDAATQRRAFEPFFSTRTAGEGTGLGLSTVYALVTRTGGTVEIRSRLRAGTRVSASWPAVDLEAPTGAVAEPVQNPLDAANVLVVEDEEMVRELVRRTLGGVGYRVVAVADAEQALAALAAGNPPDVLLTDVRLPGIDGLELARQTLQRCPDVRIVVMSGYHDLGSEDQPTRARFLAKPYTPAELISAVREALLEAPARDPAAMPDDVDPTFH